MQRILTLVFCLCSYITWSQSTDTTQAKKNADTLRIDTLKPDRVRKDSPDTDTLKTDTLATVVVKGQKMLVEKQADRTVVQVDKMLSATGSDVFKLLELVPGLTIDDDGNITLNGKSGIMVMVNDKPTYLSGAALVSYLRSLPASALEKIELMPTPPSRYDAAGTGGLINLKVKKNSLRGFNGNAQLAFTQGYLFSSNSSVNLNYRNNRVNLFSNLSLVTSNRFTDLDINRYYHDPLGNPDYTFAQNTYIRMRSQSPSIRLGMDYTLNSKTTIGVLGNLMFRPGSQTNDNQSWITQPDGSLDSSTIALNTEKDKWKNYSLNLNINRQMPGNATLTGDLDYIRYQSVTRQQFNNLTTVGANKRTDELRGHLPGEIDILAAKIDYARPIKNWKLEAGAKSSMAYTDNRYNFTAIEGGSEYPDYDKSNNFRYRENIHAGYLSMQTDKGPLSFKAGLRAEGTVSRGHQLGNPQKPDSIVRRNYMNLFPTVYIGYRLDSAGNHQLNFSFGKRIERPFYQDLNPYVTPLDKFTLYVGNPFLKPSISTDYSISYTFRKMLTVTATYNDMRDAFTEAITVNGNNYISRPDNLGRNQLLIFSTNLGLPITKWWTSNTYIEAGNRKFHGKAFIRDIDSAAWYGMINITNQFQIGKGWSAELGGFYRTSVLFGQVSLDPLWLLNLGVQKKVLKDKGNIRLAVRDPFYSAIRDGKIHFLQMAKADFRNRPDSRTVTLSFSLRFGSGKQQSSRKTGGAEEEINRVRS
ncbi:MAG TPA: outer membrane beta-barrel protein [Flavihumibacter sp.]